MAEEFGAGKAAFGGRRFQPQDTSLTSEVAAGIPEPHTGWPPATAVAPVGLEPAGRTAVDRAALKSGSTDLQLEPTEE
jgi:hypothetical protein